MCRLNDRVCARSNKVAAPFKSVKWGIIINMVVTFLLLASSAYAHTNGEAGNKRLVKRAPIPGGADLIQHVAPVVSSLFSNTQVIGALHNNPVQVENLYKPPVNPYSQLQESTQPASANSKPVMRKVNGRGDFRDISRKKLNRLNRKKQYQMDPSTKGNLLSTITTSNDQMVPHTSDRRELKSSSSSSKPKKSREKKKKKGDDKDAPPPPTSYTSCYSCHDSPSQATGPGYPGPWNGAKRVFNPTIGSGGQKAVKSVMLIAMAAAPVTGGVVLHGITKGMHSRGETWKEKYDDKVAAAKAKTQAIAEATRAKGQVLLEATKVRGQALVEASKAKAQDLVGNVRDRWRGAAQSTQSTIDVAHDEEAGHHHQGRYEPFIAGYPINSHSNQHFGTQPSQHYNPASHVGGRNHPPRPLHREGATYDPQRSSGRYNEEEVDPDGPPPLDWSPPPKAGIYDASVRIPGIPKSHNNEGNGLDYRLNSNFAGDILYATHKDIPYSGPSSGGDGHHLPPPFH